MFFFCLFVFKVKINKTKEKISSWSPYLTWRMSMSLRMRHWQILQKQLQNLLTFIFIHQFFIQQLVLSLMSVKLNKLKVFLVLNYIFKCCRLLFFFFFYRGMETFALITSSARSVYLQFLCCCWKTGGNVPKGYAY